MYFLQMINVLFGNIVENKGVIRLQLMSSLHALNKLSVPIIRPQRQNI